MDKHIDAKELAPIITIDLGRTVPRHPLQFDGAHKQQRGRAGIVVLPRGTDCIICAARR
jgi:hypothetical protein